MAQLEKKLILSSDLSGKTEAEKANRELELATAHQNNPTLVPGLNPTPSSVISQINAKNALFTQREYLRDQLKQITEDIHIADKAITAIFVDQWASQVKTAIGNDASKAKLLGWGIKNIDSGHITTGVAMAKEIILASHPNISRIDFNVHQQQSIHIVNNITGKRRLPKGILRIDIYGQTGGTMPTDYSLLGRPLGQASRGKFVHTFQLADVGKIQYYIAVYVDKKTKQPVAQSPVASAIIN